MSRLADYLRNTGRRLINLSAHRHVQSRPAGWCRVTSEAFGKQVRRWGKPKWLRLRTTRFYSGWHFAIRATDTERGEVLMLDLTARQFDETKPKVYLTTVPLYKEWVKTMFDQNH